MPFPNYRAFPQFSKIILGLSRVENNTARQETYSTFWVKPQSEHKYVWVHLHVNLYGDFRCVGGILYITLFICAHVNMLRQSTCGCLMWLLVLVVFSPSP